MRAAAGRLLLDAVRREHETIQMPRVLERARGLFAAFTHGAYELRVAAEDAASFVAIEAATGAGRAPDALSDGTRVQLLLAARLAFAEEAALKVEEEENRLAEERAEAEANAPPAPPPPTPRSKAEELLGMVGEESATAEPPKPTVEELFGKDDEKPVDATPSAAEVFGEPAAPAAVSDTRENEAKSEG